MKRPTMLAEALLLQCGRDLGLSVERDVQTLARRLKHEGLSFLTLTLPRLSDALLQGIESAQFTCPDGYQRHGSLPRFMGGFFKLVFAKDGRLLSDVSPDAIAAIRQVCDFFKKLKIPCSKARERLAIDRYLAVEGELRQRTREVESPDEGLDYISRLLWNQVFSDYDPFSLVCRHGPGVTADRYLSNERNRIRNWDDRSELSFPSDLHCYPNYGYAGEYSQERPGSDSGIKYRSVSEELGVRVVFVPKTLSAPRVIAIEPSHKQFMQQGLLQYVVKRLESHHLTRKSLRFSNQRPNQELAYRSSIDRSLATLDLKDASDRVHLHLVQRIFKNSSILEALEDSRSLHATLPDERNIVLTKFASMGSAMCFPVEAMVFYTLCLHAMHQLDGIRPTFRSISRYSNLIDIYGDDIIVPVEYADVVVRTLERYALKVNVNKSFRNSLFRESCGADYYNGVSVRPIYARQEAPERARDWLPEHVMAWISTADQFYMNGQWQVCQAIRDMVSEVVGKPIPRCRRFGAGVTFFSLLFTTNLHYDARLCGWKQKRVLYVPLKRKDIIDGDAIASLNRTWLRTRRKDLCDGAINSSTNDKFVWEEKAPEHVSQFDCNRGPGDIERTVSSESWLIRRVQDEGCKEVTDQEHVPGSDLLVRPISVSRGEQGSKRIQYGFTTVESATSTDYMSSTYRGRYKPKYRWVTVSQP